MVLHAIGYRNLSVLLTSINAIYLPIIPPLNYHISRRKSTMLFNWDEQILYLQRQLVFWIKLVFIAKFQILSSENLLHLLFLFIKI